MRGAPSGAAAARESDGCFATMGRVADSGPRLRPPELVVVRPRGSFLRKAS